MLDQVNDEALYCLTRAEQCADKAKDPSYDAASRADYRDLSQRWERLAESYQLADRISKFVEWRCLHVAPPLDFDEYEDRR